MKCLGVLVFSICDLFERWLGGPFCSVFLYETSPGRKQRTAAQQNIETAEFRRVVSFDIRHSLFDIRFSKVSYSDQTDRPGGQAGLSSVFFCFQL